MYGYNPKCDYYTQNRQVTQCEKTSTFAREAIFVSNSVYSRRCAQTFHWVSDIISMEADMTHQMFVSEMVCLVLR